MLPVRIIKETVTLPYSPYLYHKHVHPIHPTNLMQWINQQVLGDYHERITLVQSCGQGTVNQIDICGTRTQCLHLHCWFTPYRSIIHRCSIHQEIPREVMYTEWRWNGWICEMVETGTVLYTHVLLNVYKYIIYLSEWIQMEYACKCKCTFRRRHEPSWDFLKKINLLLKRHDKNNKI